MTGGSGRVATTIHVDRAVSRPATTEAPAERSARLTRRH